MHAGDSAAMGGERPQRGQDRMDAFAPLRDWVGRSETRRDVLTPAPLVALSALLDRDDAEPRQGEAAPPLAHWLYFLPGSPESELGSDGPARRAPDGEAWRREIRPDPVLLFRYSAVTFNSHRIHYDHPYATEVEGYPGLVVHGPLIATLLVDLFRRNLPRARLTRFSFRALKPLYDTAPFATCGIADAAARTARLWTRDAAGEATMEADAEHA